MQVGFFDDGRSSTNCYGYSPHRLSAYLDWLRPLLRENAKRPASQRKLTIVSVTGTAEETAKMLETLTSFAGEFAPECAVAAEFNASCPNIVGHPPPAYHESELVRYLEVLAKGATQSKGLLRVGIKLPVYTYADQFELVVRALEAVSPAVSSAEHPIAFLTSTNTLGTGLVFTEQLAHGGLPKTTAELAPGAGAFALPNPFGGLAGDAIHSISLGNVHKLHTLLKASSKPGVSAISIVGVGGVKDRAGVERMRQAGASAVACATALGREGTKIFAKL